MAQVFGGWYVDVLAGASQETERSRAIRTAKRTTTCIRWIPVGIQNKAIHVAHVTLLAMICIDNAIPTARYPSRITATSGCALGSERTRIWRSETASCGSPSLAHNRLRTQRLFITEIGSFAACVPEQYERITWIAQQQTTARHTTSSD
jgi:hypothetical protein